eukprot:scaffold1769_cov132-Skeletonema_dohrnii-CCMP3373.AAC.23
MDGLMDEWLLSIFQAGLDTLPDPKIFRCKSVVVETVPRKTCFAVAKPRKRGSRIAQITPDAFWKLAALFSLREAQSVSSVQIHGSLCRSALTAKIAADNFLHPRTV